MFDPPVSHESFQSVYLTEKEAVRQSNMEAELLKAFMHLEYTCDPSSWMILTEEYGGKPRCNRPAE